jgi:hypothetical protein
MDNKQARKTGRTIMCCGCVLIVLTKIYIGIAMIVVGLLFSLLLGRCPHCGKFLIGLSPKQNHCPKCGGRL